jgi:hypothetical protein
MSCLLQDDLKKFVSDPPPPPQLVEVPEEGKTKAKERCEIGEGENTVVVEDTSEEDDDEETLQYHLQLRSRFSLLAYLTSLLFRIRRLFYRLVWPCHRGGRAIRLANGW